MRKTRLKNQPSETAAAGPRMHYSLFGCVTVTSDFCLPSHCRQLMIQKKPHVRYFSDGLFPPQEEGIY
jgi:hypothetical protein